MRIRRGLVRSFLTVIGDTLISVPGQLIKKCRFLNPTMSPDSTSVSGVGA